MRPGRWGGALRALRLWPVAFGLAVLTACGLGDDWFDTPEGECRLGIGLGAPPCDCESWTWRLVPFLSYDPSPDLVPDWGVSPPVAEVGVGQRFEVYLQAIDRSPNRCNQGYGGGTVRSTDPSVLAADPDTERWENVFLGVAPGDATLEAIDLKTPSGGRTAVPLTVCREPGADPCPGRVPLAIRVVG